MDIDESYIKSQSYLDLREKTIDSVGPSTTGTKVAFDVNLYSGSSGLHHDEIGYVTVKGHVQPPGKTKRWELNPIFPQSIEVRMDYWGIDEGAADLLHGIVRSIRPENVLETGTHKGRSTSAIASALVKNGTGRLTTVDPVDYGLMSNGALTDDEKRVVTQVVGQTPDVFPTLDIEDIDFAFIDGDHTLAGMIKDFKFVESRIAETCIVVIDNVSDDGYPEIKGYFSNTKAGACLPTMNGMQIIELRK
jgi:predicted O-methyltransferase YrrM